MATSGEDNLLEELVGDFAGLVLPGVGPVIGKAVVRTSRAAWKRKTSKALAAAEAATGLSRKEFAAFIKNDPRGLPLYVRVLVAAGTNGHDETLRAMGAVFGHAATASANEDADGLEDAELALQAMANLGPRHFRVLRVLNEIPLVALGDENPARRNPTPENVAEAAGLREEIANQCLVNLAGAGLVTTISGMGSLVYPITALGRAVVQAAEAVTGAPSQ